MKALNRESRMGYEALAITIVEQAATDYRRARRELAKPEPGPGADAETVANHAARQRVARRRIREVEEFFRSAWCAQLVNADGRAMLARLQREVGGADD